MMYNVLTICEYVINFCDENRFIINNLKLQKLLYFIQAKFLVEKGSPCFKEEIEAWDFGPVIPIAFYKYKIFGSCHIYSIKSNANLLITRVDKELIKQVLKELALIDADELTKITRKQSPWLENYSRYRRNSIKNKDILNFFSI